MADTVRRPGSAVDSSDAHVPDQTARDDSSTSDHDEEKRHVEKEVEATSSPVTGSAGVVGLSRHRAEVDVSVSNVEDEKVVAFERTIETNENRDTKDAHVNKDDAEVDKGDTEEEDDEANMVFPSGIPLAILTFGLCMAT